MFELAVLYAWTVDYGYRMFAADTIGHVSDRGLIPITLLINFELE